MSEDQGRDPFCEDSREDSCEDPAQLTISNTSGTEFSSECFGKRVSLVLFDGDFVKKFPWSLGRSFYSSGQTNHCGTELTFAWLG